MLVHSDVFAHFPSAEAFDKCDRTGTCRPRHLVVVAPWLKCDVVCSLMQPWLLRVVNRIAEVAQISEADNTVREAKNRFVLSWMHLQCLRGRFRTTTLAMPRKSHSHDRIGHSYITIEFASISMSSHIQPQTVRCIHVVKLNHNLSHAACAFHVFLETCTADQLWGCLSRRLSNSDRMLTDQASSLQFMTS